MNELACRACRKPLLAPEGCAICNPLRRNLVVLGETDEERPSLATVSTEAVNALRAQMRAYKDAANAKGLKAEELERLRALQRAVAGAMAKLLDAARKIQADGVSAVARMSFTERAALFVEWYCSLPPVYRRQMTEQISKHEAQLALPVPEES